MTIETGEYLGLNVVNKKVRINGARSRFHGFSRDRLVKLTREQEAIKRENKFGQTKKRGGVGLGTESKVLEMLECNMFLAMWNHRI